MHNIRERGNVMWIRRRLKPVNTREQGPGLVGSASKDVWLVVGAKKAYPEMTLMSVRTVLQLIFYWVEKKWLLGQFLLLKINVNEP